MMEWWRELETLTQWFYGAAAFFSAIFLWQFISSLIGMSGAEDVDMDADVDVDVDADFDIDDLEADAVRHPLDLLQAVVFQVLVANGIVGIGFEHGRHVALLEYPDSVVI